MWISQGTAAKSLVNVCSAYLLNSPPGTFAAVKAHLHRQQNYIAGESKGVGSDQRQIVEGKTVSKPEEKSGIYDNQLPE
jgi:hypothetical protein